MGLDKIQTLLIPNVQTFGQFLREMRRRLLENFPQRRKAMFRGYILFAGLGQELQWYRLI